MSTPLDPPVLAGWHAALVAVPALSAGVAALAAARAGDPAVAWRAARAGTLAALGAAAASLAAVALGSEGAAGGLRADWLGGIVLLLVAFVGWVIVRYSRPYLAGQARELAYVGWLSATLAAVAAVAVADHLLLLALAWSATSLSLHRLLNFFDDRPAAVVAAHKKFLVARIADVCMLAAIALLASAYGTLSLQALLAQAAGASGVPAAAQAAMLLVAVAALLKCAQLPFHGWLIQVMEAPTPVSALLHAGIVNLGGFVLIRFAPVLADAPHAQALLVVAGTCTAVVAALVMTTRISVKVMLAWSTCAQMGFMLMQIGLGVWEMALLHLVAHSLYKAHAFLGAGGAVRASTIARMAPAEPVPGAGGLLGGMVAGVAATGLAALAFSPWLHPSPTFAVLAGIVALAVAPLARPRAGAQGAGWLAATFGGAFAVAAAWFALHVAISGRLAPEGTPQWPLWAVVAIGFAVLFALQSIVQAAPGGALATRLYPWFYGGMFLDERFSRALFRLAPPPLPAPSRTASLEPVPSGARS
jgi:NAD(P)H-quinone oxidoreductase subunit 5